MNELPLYPGSRPCLRSGHCCKTAPCPFGEGIPCRYLEGESPGKYRCSIAEDITRREGWQVAPAFGAGCCSPLNSSRQSLVKLLREGIEPRSEVDVGDDVVVVHAEDTAGKGES